MRRIDGGTRSHRFLGHPPGLGVIAVAQGAWYFTRYGAQSIMVLYLAHVLFNAAAHPAVLGGWGLRHLLGWEIGAGQGSQVGGQALAAALIGTLAFAAMPVQILGGLLADRVLGRRWGTALGLACLTVAPLLWSFDFSFVLGLPFSVCGLALANTLNAQVGDLYRPGDERLADAFQLLALVQDAAVVLGPLICGGAAAWAGYHAGFAVAAVVMGTGTLTYLLGWASLPRPAGDDARTARPGPGPGPGPGANAETETNWRLLAILAGLVPVLALAQVGNEQVYDTYILWGEQHYARTLFGLTMPASWLLSLDAGISLATQIAGLAFWRAYERRFAAPGEIDQVAMFSVIAALAPLVLALAAARSPHGPTISLLWGILFHTINDFAMSAVMPIGMALYVRVSPAGLKGTIVAGFALITRLSDVIAGRLGAMLPDLGSTRFWLAHAALIAVAACLLILAARLFRAELAPAERTRRTGARIIEV